MQDYRDRNRLWQPSHLQYKIDNAHVVLGGMGGIGWSIGSALIGLGVRNFSVFDPDVLETVNINRLWGCHRHQLGQPKVEIFAALAHEVDPAINIARFRQTIPSDEFVQAIAKADVVFGGYDLPEPRLATQVLALKHNTVYIDTGTAIQPHREGSFSGFGQVFLSSSPADVCIVCAGLRMDDMGYRGEGGGPLPSSGVINGVLANLAVSTWMKSLMGEPTESLIRFDWNSATLSTVPALHKRNECPICGADPAWKRSWEG